VPKAAGVHLRKPIRAEVTNLVELVEFVAANQKANPAVLKASSRPVRAETISPSLEGGHNVPGTRDLPRERRRSLIPTPPLEKP